MKPPVYLLRLAEDTGTGFPVAVWSGGSSAEAMNTVAAHAIAAHPNSDSSKSLDFIAVLSRRREPARVA